MRSILDLNENKPGTDRASEPGLWGGAHIRLILNESGGDIEYDCARGTLSEPLIVDSEGRFSVRGTHVHETPGPIRLGFKPTPQAAQYSGTLNGLTLELTVTLSESQTTVGTFKLTQGDEGRLWKCK